MSAKQEALTLPAGEFKAKCLKLMDEANLTKTPITVTKRGKIVGQFVPGIPAEKPFRSLFGRTKGSISLTSSDRRKTKDEWAADWDESTERLARQVDGDFREPKGKR